MKEAYKLRNSELNAMKKPKTSSSKEIEEEESEDGKSVHDSDVKEKNLEEEADATVD